MRKHKHTGAHTYTQAQPRTHTNAHVSTCRSYGMTYICSMEVAVTQSFSLLRTRVHTSTRKCRQAHTQTRLAHSHTNVSSTFDLSSSSSFVSSTEGLTCGRWRCCCGSRITWIVNCRATSATATRLLSWPTNWSISPSSPRRIATKSPPSSNKTSSWDSPIDLPIRHWRSSRRTVLITHPCFLVVMVQNSLIFQHLIIHLPTSSRVRERCERASEWPSTFFLGSWLFWTIVQSLSCSHIDLTRP